MTVIAGGRMPAAAVAAAISASGAGPCADRAAAVGDGRRRGLRIHPPAMSSAAIAARLADPHHDHQRRPGPGQRA